jgi:hypothetical protein
LYRLFETRNEIVLYDAVAVCGIGELDPQNLRVFFRLTEAIGWFLIVSFGFNYSDGEIRPITKKIVGSLLLATDCPIAGYDYPTVGEGPLLIYVIVRPAGIV